MLIKDLLELTSTTCEGRGSFLLQRELRRKECWIVCVNYKNTVFYSDNI